MKSLLIILSSALIFSSLAIAKTKLPENQRIIRWSHSGFGIDIEKGDTFPIHKYMRKRGYSLKEWRIIEADLRILFFNPKGIDQTVSLTSGKDIIDTQTLKFTDDYEHNDPTTLTFTNNSDINNKKWGFKLEEGNRISIVSILLLIERI